MAGMTGTGRNRQGTRTPLRGRVLQGLMAGILVWALAACSAVYRNHGYVPPEEDLAQLVVGTDTRETAAPKVGRPSTSGLLNDTGWYFVQSQWEYKGALPPRELDRQVVALTFSESGTLTNVERFGLERGRVVPLSRRVTESNVQGLSVIAQLFSSFGRVNAGQLLNN